jgi:anti-sigma regulatory factor (Ser/Thr protein kinase)/CheY-like chemotaxis protein
MSPIPFPGTAPASLKTALVVDADPQVESALGAALDPRRWMIQHASDNAQATALVQASIYELVITSEKAPGIEDVALLRKLRGVHPHTKLIILTDDFTPADVLASMREHAFSHFCRTLSYHSLAYIIQLAAEGPCWDDGIELLSATPAWIHLTARCDLGTAKRLVQFINEVAELPNIEKEEVATAFREILLNAIEHGGRFDGSQSVEIAYLRARHAVICRVKGPGPGFSQEAILHSAMANSPDDPIRHNAYGEEQSLRPSRYGVLIARDFVDDLIFNEKANNVVLIKYLAASSE